MIYKQGDKVRIHSTNLFEEHMLGKVVTVDTHKGILVYVVDDDGNNDYGYEHEVSLVVQHETPTPTPVVGNTKYNREIKPNVFVDVYDVLYAFKVTDPCLQHLIKKALAAGQRGHKDARQDLVDIRDSAQRALESYDLWEDKE